MYEIKNRRTGKWLFGTWWQDGRVIQRTSSERALLLETLEDAQREMIYRHCGKDYCAVPVRVEVDA